MIELDGRNEAPEITPGLAWYVGIILIAWGFIYGACAIEESIFSPVD